jgi:hypothetical protein
MELSCLAASAQHCMEFRTECTDPDDLKGDNCSDLLCGFLSHLFQYASEEFPMLFPNFEIVLFPGMLWKIIRNYLS